MRDESIERGVREVYEAVPYAVNGDCSPAMARLRRALEAGSISGRNAFNHATANVALADVPEVAELVSLLTQPRGEHKTVNGRKDEVPISREFHTNLLERAYTYANVRQLVEHISTIAQRAQSRRQYAVAHAYERAIYAMRMLIARYGDDTQASYDAGTTVRVTREVDAAIREEWHVMALRRGRSLNVRAPRLGVRRSSIG